MKLVYVTCPCHEVKIGDIVELAGGLKLRVVHYDPPHKPSSSGLVTVALPDGSHQEYYVGVIGAKWIKREDQERIEHGTQET